MANLFRPTKRALDRAYFEASKAPREQADAARLTSLLADVHRQLVTISRALWILGIIALALLGRIGDALSNR